MKQEKIKYYIKAEQWKGGYMISLEEVLKAFNDRLNKDGFIERFELRHFTYEHQGELISFDALFIPNSQEELSIQLSYDYNWILYYLGFHEHFDFIETLDDLFELVYNTIVLVLKDDIMAARVVFPTKRSDGIISMGACCYIPKEIPFIFNEEELNQARISSAVCWSGKEIKEQVICYILSEREDVNEYKQQFI